MFYFIMTVYNFLEQLLLYSVTLYLIYFVYFRYFDKKKKVEKVAPAFEFSNNETKKLYAKSTNNFYGKVELENHEKVFLDDLIKNEKSLESDGQIGVDAAVLFSAMRSPIGNTFLSKSQRYILEEKIMNFKVPLADGEAPREISKILPYYIARIEELPDGGYRQWFTPEHTESCGVKTLRYDGYGRSRGDPEMDALDEKNKKKERLKMNRNNQKSTEDSLRKILKKMDKTDELLAEIIHK